MLTKIVVKKVSKMLWRPKIVQIFVISDYIYKLFPACQTFSVTDGRRETHIAISVTELWSIINL